MLQWIFASSLHSLFTLGALIHLAANFAAIIGSKAESKLDDTTLWGKRPAITRGERLREFALYMMMGWIIESGLWHFSKKSWINFAIAQGWRTDRRKIQASTEKSRRRQDRLSAKAIHARTFKK